MPETSIRQATPDDASLIATIIRGIHELKKFVDEPFENTFTRVQDMLTYAQRNDRSLILIAETGDIAVGYCAIHWFPQMLHGIEGYISELFVLPNYRSRGIGKILLNYVLSVSQERDCRLVRLLNRKDRESYNRSFYAKSGWVENEIMAVFEYHPELLKTVTKIE
jgi:ribosomal protein S18 acetylase RimI-like enzyme